MTDSKLTKFQIRTFGPGHHPSLEKEFGAGARIVVTVRYDDTNGSGHNTFSITAEVSTNESRRRGDINSGGQMHDYVVRYFPQLAPLIKWHLTTSDGPTYYVSNTLYWLGYPNSEPNLDHARQNAVWSNLPADMLASSKRYTEDEATRILKERLPGLMAEFRHDITEFGFVF